MRFYRCDRCGREYTVNRHGINEGALGLRNPTETCLTIDLPTDLCDGCRKDFEAWFRQPMVDKAFEEAHAKAHAHEKGDVTLLGVDGYGKVICPVCGLVFNLISPKIVKVDNTYYDFYGECPKCKTPFNENINYVNLKKGGDSDDTTGTKN